MSSMRLWQLRTLLNAVNGSSLLGIAVARLGGAHLTRRPRGLLIATGYRLGFPPAPAFTVGSVVLCRHELAWLDQRPALLAHEERHTWQYAVCLGLPLLPLYLLAAGWSWARGGDVAVHNAFERLAGLEDGGYPVLSARARRRQPTG